MRQHKEKIQITVYVIVAFIACFLFGHYQDIIFTFFKAVPVNIWVSVCTITATIGAVLYTQRKTEKRFARQHMLDNKMKAEENVLEKEAEMIRGLIAASKAFSKVYDDILILFVLYKKYVTENKSIDVKSSINAINYQFILIDGDLMFIEYLSGYCGSDVFGKYQDLYCKYTKFKNTTKEHMQPIIIEVKYKHFKGDLFVRDDFESLIRSASECINHIQKRDNNFKQRIRDLAIGLDIPSNNKK
ncbi:hypothetical protein [uncultured Shewanella sp.]|uniref:hypothetical protein n=1 Tax=uncultured Shewanella sp. TaxID=173975 RepID=UPI002602B863|nr:hypothetical protein [uncultured Shewanella sp.]